MHDEAALLADYPAPILVSAERVASESADDRRVLVVLDDDPTGTQSVADLPVLTAWAPEDFRWAFAQHTRAIYVLTNTRSLGADAAAERIREVVAAAAAVATELGLPIVFVSRGDSTLRGHFPLETDVIAGSVSTPPDAVVIVPAFPDAGRITIGGVHYLRSDQALIPVAETEFARDATFGYLHSDLSQWVEERTAGRWTSDAVIHIALDTLRRGPDAIAAVLLPLTGGVPVVVDTVTEDDLRLLALGMLRAERAGRTLLYRVGPPFVRAVIGQAVRAPLTAPEIYGERGSEAIGGLIVVGSHVGLTSRQLDCLTERGRLAATLELDIDRVLDPTTSARHRESLVAEAVDALGRGDVVVHTSRLLRSVDDAAGSLEIARRVSAAVVTVVKDICAVTVPRFVVAKGGITSSDIASKALGIRHAIVRGPMLPGIVSLWQPVGGAADGIPYVVFAGNVGDDESLATVVHTLSRPIAERLPHESSTT